jgi:hypothetical protein
MNPSIEVREAVIRHHDQRRVVSSFFHRLADHAVGGAVVFQQLVLVLAPKHVGILIHTRNIEEQQTTLEFLKLVAEQRARLFQNSSRLVEKLLQRQRAFAQRRSIFRHALRVEKAHRLRQRFAVGRRRRDR